MNMIEIQKQHEEYHEYAESTKKDLALGLAKHFGVEMGTTLIGIAYDLQMEDQMHGREDSSLNIFEFRVPDKEDVEQLQRAMNEIAYGYTRSKMFKKLSEAVDEFLTKG